MANYPNLGVIKYASEEFQIRTINKIPTGAEVWKIGNNAPEGVILFAHFDSNRHMRKDLQKYAVLTPNSLEIADGASYAGFTISEMQEYLKKEDADPWIYKKVVKSMPYLVELWEQTK